jgi:hypothetical protein
LARLEREQEGEERGPLVPGQLAKRLGAGGSPSVMGQDSHPAHWWRGHLQEPATHAEAHSGVVRQSLPVAHRSKLLREFRGMPPQDDS